MQQLLPRPSPFPSPPSPLPLYLPSPLLPPQLLRHRRAPLGEVPRSSTVPHKPGRVGTLPHLRRPVQSELGGRLLRSARGRRQPWLGLRQRLRRRALYLLHSLLSHTRLSPLSLLHPPLALSPLSPLSSHPPLSYAPSFRMTSVPRRPSGLFSPLLSPCPTQPRPRESQAALTPPRRRLRALSAARCPARSPSTGACWSKKEKTAGGRTSGVVRRCLCRLECVLGTCRYSL
ncbi:hypothetical protein T484DRAFT_2678939 [Baffinella frigidus]|nr:hypothetical protein T484DRAFT_2678939 [Cryptophyta sp. CCMP2293]